MTMGDRIRQLRENANMSQEQLGNRLGIGKSAVAKYENGRVENIPRESVLIMASMFNVAPEYLLAYTDDEKMGFLSEEMIEMGVIKKYGKNVFALLDMFEAMTDKNKDKLLTLSEDIVKSQKYDSAAQMFK